MTRDTSPLAPMDPAGFPGPMPAYRAKRAAGLLKPDPMQEYAAEQLQILHRALLNYRPAPPQAAPIGWRARLGFAPAPVAVPKPPKGLYIFGGVGRGKSMLMDLFFETSAVPAKRRVHFHAFMQEVHDRLHRLRADRSVEPIPVLARAIAEGATLLCFDEFQVTDIADAMIIGRLFEALFEAGTVVVATSNRAPDELYKDGLQRERFLPFIATLKQRLEVLELENGRDYRLSRLIGRQLYLTPNDAAAAAGLEAIFRDLTDEVRPEPLVLEVKKRRLTVPRQAMAVAWFEFADLCAQPLGPGDYLAIAERFETVIIANIPELGADRRDEAKRFNTLIDTLYEAKVHVVISAAAPPDRLYVDGDGAFEFQRTVSRLMEMGSAEYLAHRRGSAVMTAPKAPPALAAPGVSR